MRLKVILCIESVGAVANSFELYCPFNFVIIRLKYQPHTTHPSVEKSPYFPLKMTQTDMSRSTKIYIFTRNFNW